MAGWGDGKRMNQQPRGARGWSEGAEDRQDTVRAGAIRARVLTKEKKAKVGRG